MLARAAIKPRRRNSPRPAWKVARAYGQWLRGRPCACEGRNPACSGPIQAAHVPHKASKGVATKAADQYQIPLSEGCHLKTQHRKGWQTFAAMFLGGRDPVALSEDYWRLWPGRARWEARQSNG
jgi:hypothetical protein